MGSKPRASGEVLWDPVQKETAPAWGEDEWEQRPRPKVSINGSCSPLKGELQWEKKLTLGRLW